MGIVIQYILNNTTEFSLMESEFKIEVISKNGEETILHNRRLKLELNTLTSNRIYNILETQPMSKLHNNQPQIKSSNSKRLVKDPSYDEVVQMGTKLVSTISEYLAGDIGFENVEQDDKSTVTLKNIALLASRIVNENSDSLFQKLMAKKPNREKIDEKVQHAVLEKYLPSWKIEKLNEGYLTVHDGEFKFNKAGKIAKSKKESAKSIDFLCQKDAYTIYVFSKFAKVAGGVQDHQMKESGWFINQVETYKKKYPDQNVKFVDLLDGAYAETHIEHHSNLVPANLKNDIFVGNCEQVINWIETLA